MAVDEKSVILEVENLHTQFSTDDGLVQAVNGISLSLREGETLAIVGESGCGKSVSMLSVMRLLNVPPAKITADRLFFKDIDVMALSKEDMRKVRGSEIAMIFQDPMTSLNPVLTIGFQLKEPLKLHLGMGDTGATKRAAELLEMVGIPDAEARLRDYPHQFSGGMRQRAMIAMALACNPSVLIADEPTTALDVTIQAQIVDLIQRLQKRIGMALIWITHDLGVVAGLADRVNVMYAGFIVESAFVDELYENPRHPYTAALLRSLPRIDGSVGEDLESIKGLPPDLIDLPKGCPFAARCSFTVDKCRVDNPHLEEISPEHKIACWIDVDTGGLR
ncbi:MAG: peptide ABC transporter ATP-binding protein [Candidatus Zixiibacteriota bacterium]|nr:MAG: peptide ABC transporter ATP-binding protein [candidate division Zixibacteria bacterium]